MPPLMIVMLQAIYNSLAIGLAHQLYRCALESWVKVGGIGYVGISVGPLTCHQEAYVDPLRLIGLKVVDKIETSLLPNQNNPKP